MTFKPAYWHFVYISALILLGFQYYSKATLLERTCESLGGINQQLQDDAEIISASAESMKYEIRKKTETNPKRYRSYYLKSETADTVVKNALAYLKECKNQFKATSSLDKNKIQEIKQHLSNSMNALTNVDDSVHKEAIIKKGHLKFFLENESYWKRFINLPYETILTEFFKIENILLNDENIFLNYTLERVSQEIDLIFDKYKVAIAPKKAALIEGEYFESDIYITKYSSNPMEMSIRVNGIDLPLKDGVAHYKSKFQSTGKKSIEAVASIRNLMTGELITTKGAFDYEVLPKCSRDCQQ